jgi:hypothetical protein
MALNKPALYSVVQLWKDDRQRGIASRFKNARARPAAVDPHAPNGGDRHDWIFGEPGVDAAGQEPQRATLRGFEILAESKKRAKNDRKDGLSKRSRRPSKSPSSVHND